MTDFNIEVTDEARADKAVAEVDSKGGTTNLKTTSIQISDNFLLGGRLKYFWEKWSDPEIRTMLREGLSWQWKAEKPNAFIKPKWSSADKRLRGPVEEMLELGVICPVKEASICFMGTIFGKEKPNGKIRTILDISQLNIFILNEHFKMLKVADVPLSIQQNVLFISVDLTSAYWHIPIHAHFQKYLTLLY